MKEESKYNWICDCPEWWIQPAWRMTCVDCEARKKKKRILKHSWLTKKCIRCLKDFDYHTGDIPLPFHCSRSCATKTKMRNYWDKRKKYERTISL